MQVKKFEAPTIQEALDTIKRELGPDAIILQTKKNKRGFGLMSSASFEVTAAVSERSLQKKQYVEKRLPDRTREAVKNMPAQKQADYFEKATQKIKPPVTSSNSGSRTLLSSRPSPAAGAYQATLAGPALGAAPHRGAPAPVDQLLESAQRGFSGARNGGVKDALVNLSRAAFTAKSPPAAPAPVTPSMPEQRYADISDFDEEGDAGARMEDPLSKGIDPGPRKPHPPIVASGNGERSYHPLDEEVRHLKRMIEELKNAQDQQEMSGSGASALVHGSSYQSEGSALSTPALQGAFEQLVINGLEKRYAYSLIRTVAFEIGPERSLSPDEVLDQIAIEIMRSTRVLSPLEGLKSGEGGGVQESARKKAPLTIALVGPTGVGKTTTIAKLASDAIIKRNLRVGLINLDSYKIAAFDQLGTYAKILNVPFRSVATGVELGSALQDFQSLDLILVDTTGRSQRDPSSLKEMQEVLSSASNIRSQLVLSVTTRDSELYDIANRFSVFRPEGIIFSKLDEATTYGSIYNVIRRAELPLVCFTTGQRVPEDIEEATRERVAALLLEL